MCSSNENVMGIVGGLAAAGVLLLSAYAEKHGLQAPAHAQAAPAAASAGAAGGVHSDSARTEGTGAP